MRIWTCTFLTIFPARHHRAAVARVTFSFIYIFYLFIYLPPSGPSADSTPILTVGLPSRPQPCFSYTTYMIRINDLAQRLNYYSHFFATSTGHLPYPRPRKYKKQYIITYSRSAAPYVSQSDQLFLGYLLCNIHLLANRKRGIGSFFSIVK